MHLIPNVINENRAMDIYSTLLEDRVIMLSSPIDDVVASSIVAQLLFLEAKDPHKDIYLYINSPGGSVTSGLAIFDTMNYVTCDINTIAIGQAASMGALLLSSGTKGKRYALPSSRIMIHQPLGGANGQATDIEIMAEEILRLKKYLNSILAKNTGKREKSIMHDTERDNFMTAADALKYNLIDEVITNKRPTISEKVK